MGCRDKVKAKEFKRKNSAVPLPNGSYARCQKQGPCVLLMWSRDLSPNILRSGWWSTAMVRFLHPRTKCLALSRASATASASASIGISGFGGMCELASYPSDLPALFATEEVIGGAEAVFLE